jgi:hypothetical protein
MTLGELLTEVRNLLAYELEGESYTDAQILPYVYHALRDFALQAWWRFGYSRRKDSAGMLPAGTQEVDFADRNTYDPPLLQVRRVWWENNELLVLPQSEVGLYLTGSGSPRRVLIQGSRVQLFPIPSSAGVIAAWGIIYPALPSLGSDVIDFPAGFEHYLAHGVVWQIAFQKGMANSPNVVRSRQVWQEGIIVHKMRASGEEVRGENTLRR